MKSKRFAAAWNRFFTSQNATESSNYQPIQFEVEALEPRMMLNGDQTLIFAAGFEDVTVRQGSFAHFDTVSGFTATGNPVEVQSNHRSVGRASEGAQHLELDRDNGIFVQIDPSNSEDLTLQFDYSPRSRVSELDNTIEVWWQGELVGEVGEEGSRSRETNFREIEFTLEGVRTTGILEFRSVSAANVSRGGLLDDVRVFETNAPLGPLALAAIDDQEVVNGESFSVTATLLPPDTGLDGAEFSLVEAPVGLEIDSETGEITWTATQSNIDATLALNSRTEIGEPQLIFETSFEEVDVRTQRVDFFQEISGFTASGGIGKGIEVQDNHRLVGGASDGEQHVEIDRTNRLTQAFETTPGNQYELVFDYSPRSGIDSVNNAIDVFWDGQLIDTISRDGTNLSTTDWREVRLDLSDFSGDLTELEFRSTDPGDSETRGGLIDHVRIFETPVTVISDFTGAFDVTVLVTGPEGRQDTESFNINVLEAPAPVGPLALEAIADQEIASGESFNVTATLLPPDTDLDGAVYSLVEAPVGLEIDSETGEITWTATQSNIDASDALNDTTEIGEPQLIFETSFEEVDVDTGRVDFFSEISGFIANGGVGQGIEVQDNHRSVGEASDGEQHVEIDRNNNLVQEFATTPGNQYELVFDYSPRPRIDAANNAIEVLWDGQVVETVSGNGVGVTGTRFREVRVDLSNFTGDVTQLEFRSQEPGQRATFGGLIDHVRIFETPVNVIDAPDGKYDVTVLVTGPDGRQDTETFAICLIDHAAPVIESIDDQTINEEEAFSLPVVATDTDSTDDQLTYSITSGPDGLAIDAASGEITWTPTEAQGPGQYSVTVVVTDETGLTAEETFNIDVAEVNVAPVLAEISAVTTDIGSPVTFTATATDTDLPANTLTFSLGAGAPTDAVIDASTGEFTFTPDASTEGQSFSFEVIVDDGAGGTDSQIVTIDVNLIPNGAPSIAPIADQPIDEEQTLTLTVEASDPDLPDDTLTFAITSGPNGLTIDSQTGEITWTPTETDGPGQFQVTVNVTDREGLTAEETFNVIVGEVNVPPVLAPIAPLTIDAEDVVTFTATATDSDIPANTLTYSLGTGAPDGAAIDSSTGQFIWTSDATDEGQSFSFDVVVDDGAGGTDSQTVTIDVRETVVVLTVASQLQRDTARGGVNNDLLTFDPTIDGTVSVPAGGSEVVQLEAGFAAGTLIDVSGSLNNDGTYTLSEATLETINGGPLADGVYTIFVLATDADGNQSVPTPFTFTLDQTAPELAADLTAATDTGATGDRTTLNGLVDIELTSEAGAALFAGGNNIFEADADGLAIVEDVELTVGENEGQFGAVDLAGNVSSLEETFTRIESNQPNRDPVFVTEPTTLFQIPGESNEPQGEVDPGLVEIDLLGQFPQTQTLSIRIPTEEVSTAFADIVFVVDESGSLAGEQAFIGPTVERLNAELEAQGIGPNRFALVGFTDQTRQFDGNAGTNLRLFNAEGTEIDDYTVGAFNDLREIAVGANQEFVLLVENTLEESIDDFSFEVFAREVIESELVPGDNLGTITQPAQTHRYTFSTTEFETFFFDSLTNEANLLWTLTGPTGVVANNLRLSASDSFSRSPVFNLEPGDYELVIDGVADFTGDFGFRFQSIDVATELTPGTPVSGAFENPAETDAYFFNANAGDKFFFDAVNVSDRPNSLYRIVDPFGGLLVNSNQFTDIDVVEIPFDGVYTILVESQVSNSNATVDTYELNVLPVVDTTTPLVIGQTTSGAITSFGQTESFTFDVPEFGSYYFDNFSLTSSVRWTLSGPAGNVVSNRVVSATDSLNGNGVLNLAAGSYTLTFDGTGEDLGEYEFRIIDLATATSIELDTPTTGEFTNPTETDAYQFEATGGDEIILEFTEVSDFRSSAYRLIDQNGLLVVSGRSLVSSIPVTLGLTGTYTLVVESSVRNEDVDTYTVNVALQGNTPIVPFAGEALVLGTPVSGEIGGPDAIDPYQFTLTERTTVHFDSRTNSALTWSLVGPEGTLINNRRFDQSDSFNGNTILDLPAGDYQLQVTGSTSGEYSFNLLALSDAAVITPGTPFSGTLTTPTQTDAYQFDANEGELFYFDVVSASDDRNSLFRLIDPAGETAFTSTRLNDRAVFEIELAGTYTLLVEGGRANVDADTYEINVVPTVAGTQALNLGTVIDGQIVSPGDTQTYTFEVEDYGVFYIDSLTNDSGLTYTIESQERALLSNRSLSLSDANGRVPVYALAPGLYEITIQGSGDATGDFSFQFSSADTATEITPGDSFVVDLVSNETQAFTWQANAGDQFYADVVTPPTGAGNFVYSVYDRYGTRLLFTTAANDFNTFTAEHDGEYLLLVEANVNSDAPDSFEINISPVLSETAAINIGDQIDGSIGSAGEVVTYTFTVQERQNFYFDSLTNNSTLTWTLEDAEGTIVNNRRFDRSDSFDASGTVQLGAGDYTLTVDASVDNTGDFSFRLSSLDLATEITRGTLVGNTFTDPRQSDLYRFDGVAGERLFVNILSTADNPGNDVWYRIFAPDGSTLNLSSRLSDLETNELPFDGTYYLAIEGRSNNVDFLTYELSLDGISDNVIPLTTGQRIAGSIEAPGAEQVYVFDAPEYGIYFFDNLTTDSDLRWSIEGPTGFSQVVTRFTTGGLVELEPGQHRLTIEAIGDSTPDFAFTLLNFAEATVVTPGTPITSELSESFETQAFQFDAVAGEKFFLDIEAADAASTRYDIYDPIGALVVSNQQFSSNGETGELPADGTYTLLVRGLVQNLNADTFEINITPVTTSSTPLTFGSVVNGTIANFGDTAEFTFQLAEHGNFFIDSLTNERDVTWTLIRDGITVDTNNAFSFTDSFSGNPILRDLAPGNYRLVVDGADEFTGDFSFQFTNLNSVAPITYDTPVDGELTNPRESDLYQFEATAGDEIIIEFPAASDTNSSAYRIVDAYGQLVFFDRGLNTSDVISLGLSGTYTLSIEGTIDNSDADVDSYTVNVAFQGNTPVAPLVGTALTLNSDVTGTLAEGEVDSFVFELTERTSIYFDSFTNNSSLRWNLTGPTGTVLSNIPFTSSDAFSGFRVQNLPVGEYQLEVFGLAGATGDYLFRVDSLDSATAITPGTSVSGEFTRAAETDLYQFDANAGDQFFIDILSTSDINNALYRVIDPLGNSVINSNRLNDLDLFTVDLDGTYTLAFEGAVNNTGTDTYEFLLQPVTATTAALTLGQLTTGNIDVAGDVDSYTFEVTEFGSFFVDTLNFESDLRFSVTDQNGVRQGNSFGFTSLISTNNAVFTLAPGEYTILIDGTGNFTGEYAFSFTPFAQAVEIVPGTAFTTTLSNPLEISAFQFDANAGDSFFLDVVDDDTLRNVSYRLFDEFGQIEFFSTRLQDLESFVLAEAGTYTLLVEPRGDNTENISFTINILSTNAPITAATLGDRFTTQLAPGTSAIYELELLENDRFIIDSLITEDVGAEFVVLNVFGEEIYRESTEENSGPLTATNPGTYQVVVENNQDIAAELEFRLLGVNDLVVEAGDVVGSEFIEQNALSVHRLVSNGDELVLRPVRDKSFLSAAAFNQVSQFLSTGQGGTEDGYLGTTFAIENAEFRENAARSAILITDEDRDIVDPNLTFESMVQLFIENDVTFSTILNANFDDANGDPAIGILANQNSIVADGNGGFIEEPNGVIFSAVGEEEYVDLAFAVNGAAFDLNQLRAGGTVADSFTQAFVEVSTRAIVDQFGLDIVSTNPNFDFENLTGVVTGVLPGDTVEFDIQVNEGNEAGAFDLVFVREGTGVVVGSVPVRIAGSYNYDSEAVDPDGDTVTYTLVSGPEGATVDPVTGEVDFRPDTPGEFDFEILAEDGNGGSATQAFTVTVEAGRANLQPVITSSPVRFVEVANDYQYQVVATDGDDDQLQYFLNDGPDGLSIDRLTGLITWSADLVVGGNFNVSVNVVDGFGGQTTQVYELRVNTPPRFVSPPRVNAVPNLPYAYQTVVADDDGDALQYSILTGPTGLVIDQNGLVTWTPSADDVDGTNEVSIQVVDAFGARVTQTFSINVITDVSLPTVDLITNAEAVNEGGAVQFEVQAFDDVGVESIVLTVDGAEIDLDVDNRATVTFPTIGVFTATVLVTDSSGNQTENTVRIRVLDPNDNEAPVVVINTPAEGTDIEYISNIIASVTDDNLDSYRVEFARADLVNLDDLLADDSDFQLISEGFANVENEVVGQFDGTILANDSYIIRVIATDVNGSVSAAAHQVNVVGQAKLGNLFLEFTDLVTSLDGVQIQINRVYDSLEAGNQGDFGFGWNIALFNSNIRESVPDAEPSFLGAGETPFMRGTRVFITAPNGERQGYTFEPEPSLVGIFGATFVPAFEADPGIEWRLEVPETSTGANIVSFNNQGEAVLPFAGFVYNPETYILISPEGVRFTYEQHGSLTQIEDADGNIVSVNANGLQGSDGRSIEFERDSEGRITKITDADGNEQTYEYDGQGDLIRFTNGESETTSYEYFSDPAHFLSAIYDNDGLEIFSTEFDDNGRLTSATDAIGATLAQTFDPGTFTGTQTDANGNVTLVTYDANGNITVEEDALGNVTESFFEDANDPNLLTREINPRGFITDYTYDDQGNLLVLAELGTEANPFATPLTKTFTYTDDNHVATVTNENGQTTSFEYDDAGNTTQIINDQGAVTTYEYDDDGRQIFYSDFNNNEITYEYSGSLTRPDRVLFNDGTVQEFEYNGFGQITLVRYLEADGSVAAESRRTFDESGRNTAIAEGENNLTTFIYDGATLTYEITRVSIPGEDLEELRVRHFEYDDVAQVTRQSTASFVYDQTADFQTQIDAALENPESSTDFRYDLAGNQILIRDAVGNITTWVYDAANRVVEERDPFFNEGLTIEEALAARLVASGADLSTDTGADHVQAFAYNAEGNLTEQIDRNGRRNEFEYDFVGRLTEERWFSASGDLENTLVYTYDDVGNLLTASDSDSRYEFVYDSLNQLTQSSNAGTEGAPTVVLNYTYDNEGNVLTVVDNEGVTIESTYTSRNLLESRIWFDADGNDVDDARVEFIYNAVGQTLELTRYAGLDQENLVGRTSRTYNLTGSTSSLTHTDGVGDLISSYAYEYDFAGNLTTETRDHSLSQFAQTIDYTFDDLGQLESADFATQQDENFTYDENGNRTSSFLHGTDYVLGTDNRLASDGIFNYSYDGEGNVILKTRIVTDADGVAGERTEFQYNNRNRLIAATVFAADGTVVTEVTYQFDAFDKRISRTENGVTEYFVYNGSNVWADFNETGEATARYLFGNSIDQSIARIRAGESTAWYLTDQQGTVRDLAGADGSLINHTEYQAYGEIVSQLDESAADRYSFTGREFDSSIGLYYFRARTYDPSIGTFYSNDQLGFSAGDSNLSRYAFNSPTRFTDPTGNTVVVSYASILDDILSDEFLAFTGFIAGFNFSTFSYLGYFLQTTSQAQALDFLARDLSQVLAFSWAVSTVGLVTDFFDIPNDALGKIDTYINGTGPEEQQDLISRLQAEANAQLDAFVGVENSLSRVTDAINGPDEFKPNDPESMLDDGGGFINGARTFISILQI